MDIRIAVWTLVSGQRVGDFAILRDGRTMRFSHHWGDSIQVSEGGSFYFGGEYMSFSGGLEPAIPVEQFQDTGETRKGSAWFFHHNQARAHNGVDVQVPCRVYKQTA